MLPDSFQPYLLNQPISNTVNFTTSGDTSLLTAGQLGIFTCPPTGSIGNAIAAGTATPCVIASGSWYTSDSINPLWGGLQEPDYTQIIDWRLVNAYYYAQGAQAVNQISTFGWNQTSGSTVGPAFFCGTTYQFQLEVSGNPALNFLNKLYYKSFTAFGGCCGTGCTSGCTSTYTDAACILLQWKDGITQDPYMPSFVAPQVFIQTSAGTAFEVYSAYDVQRATAGTYGSVLATQPGNAALQATVIAAGVYTCNTSNPQSVVASLQITCAYQQTVFKTCTFSPTDHYEVEPIYVQGSLFTQDANPCAVNTTIDTSVPNMWTQIQAPAQVRGIGQTTVRKMLEWGRYKQEDFPDSQWVGSLRQREIELYPWLNVVNLAGIYDMLYIKFNINRTYNTQQIHSNDEYALSIYFPTGTVITAFTNLINACLAASGNYITSPTVI